MHSLTRALLCVGRAAEVASSELLIARGAFGTLLLLLLVDLVVIVVVMSALPGSVELTKPPSSGLPCEGSSVVTTSLAAAVMFALPGSVELTKPPSSGLPCEGSSVVTTSLAAAVDNRLRGGLVHVVSGAGGGVTSSSSASPHCDMIEDSLLLSHPLKGVHNFRKSCTPCF